MPVIINADTVVGGAVVTADASGVLALQAAGNTGLTLNSSRAIGVGASPSFGSSGQVLTSQGSGAAPTWATPSVPGVDVQTFTSSGTWTKPALAAGSRVLIQAWGGGGSGAKGTNRNGGGGGGGYMERWVTLSSMGATETITIGAGGAAQSALSTNGNSGGNTTVGSIVTAYGGGGGVSGALYGMGGGGGGEFTAGGTSFGSIGGGGNIDVSNGWVRTISATQQNGTNAYQSRRTADAFTIYGGGAGGTYVNDCSEWGVNGGRSVWGGAGGGSSGGTTVRSDPGTSINGGNGGAAGSTGTAGTAPAGGGGASWSGNSGAGAAGRVIITVFPA